MSATVHYLPGALEAREAREAARRKGRGRTQRAPEPEYSTDMRVLEILNRTAVKLGLPALGTDLPGYPGRVADK